MGHFCRIISIRIKNKSRHINNFINIYNQTCSSKKKIYWKIFICTYNLYKDTHHLLNDHCNICWVTFHIHSFTTGWSMSLHWWCIVQSRRRFYKEAADGSRRAAANISHSEKSSGTISCPAEVPENPPETNRNMQVIQELYFLYRYWLSLFFKLHGVQTAILKHISIIGYFICKHNENQQTSAQKKEKSPEWEVLFL